MIFDSQNSIGWEIKDFKNWQKGQVQGLRAAQYLDSGITLISLLKIWMLVLNLAVAFDALNK